MASRALKQFDGRELVGQPIPREAPPPPHTPPGAAYIGLVELMRILKRRGRLVLATIAVVMALTILALMMATPVYKSSAVMLVEPTSDPVAQSGTPVVAKPDEELRIATRMELLQSRALARRIARNMRLAEDPEFAVGRDENPGIVRRMIALVRPDKNSGDPEYTGGMSAKDIQQASDQAEMEAVTSRLMDRITVERVQKSHLVSITAESQNPYKASLLANRLAETYIKGQVVEQDDAYKAQVSGLRQRVEQLRERVNLADQAVIDYRRSNNLFASRSEEMNTAMYARLSGALAEARAASAQSSARASGMSGSAALLASSPLLSELKGQEALLGKRMAELSSFYGPGHPDMVNAKAQLDDVQKRIAAETGRAQAAVGREAAIASGAVGASVGTLASELGALRSANSHEVAASVGLRELEREAETSNALYVSLMAQLKEVGGRGANDKPDARIVSRAPIPDSPAYPEVKRTLVIAFIGALALAAILAFVVENLDNRVRTADQVDRLLGLPTLAMIPDVSDQLPFRQPHEIIQHEPRSVFAESVRNLYIELLAQFDQPGSKVMVVTSPLANEGKSTVANSLAAAATTLGHSAVMLDVDLRKPAVYDALIGEEGTSHAAGTADIVAYLNDRARLDQLIGAEAEIADGDHASFVRINAHEAAQDPGALISSPRLAKLIAQLRERFDLVVLNAPPILPVRDAKILAGYADGALMVLRWGSTHPDAARVAVELFGDKMMGAVLNRVDYAEHARRNYGDAIHYYAQYAGQYPEDGKMPKPIGRIFYRALGRTAPADA